MIEKQNRLFRQANNDFFIKMFAKSWKFLREKWVLQTLKWLNGMRIKNGNNLLWLVQGFYWPLQWHVEIQWQIVCNKRLRNRVFITLQVIFSRKLKHVMWVEYMYIYIYIFIHIRYSSIQYIWSREQLDYSNFEYLNIPGKELNVKKFTEQKILFQEKPILY